ncbi:MAG: DUF190 domain-containing protein [Cyanobacteria bacterium J06614_10]
MMDSWKQLTIYTSESARWKHQPLHIVILELAKKEGISGAIVARGIEGFGPHHTMQTTNVLALASDLPIEIRMIDREAAIAAFLPIVKPLVTTGLITLEDVNVVYSSH